MNIKKHWLKSLAVAAVVAMASANASAEVLSAVTADGQVSLPSTYPQVVPGMKTPAFKHPGGWLVGTYTAACHAYAADASKTARVRASIVVVDAAGNAVAHLAPGEIDLCSSGAPVAMYSMTSAINVPPGTYRVEVRGQVYASRAVVHGYFGPRSLVVSR